MYIAGSGLLWELHEVMLEAELAQHWEPKHAIPVLLDFHIVEEQVRQHTVIQPAGQCGRITPAHQVAMGQRSLPAVFRQ